MNQIAEFVIPKDNGAEKNEQHFIRIVLGFQAGDSAKDRDSFDSGDTFEGSGGATAIESAYNYGIAIGDSDFADDLIRTSGWREVRCGSSRETVDQDVELEVQVVAFGDVGRHVDSCSGLSETGKAGRGDGVGSIHAGKWLFSYA